MNLRAWIRSKAQLRLDALDQSQAMVEFNIAGKVLFANTRFLELTGYTKGEIEGLHHSIFVSPDYARSAEYKAFWAELRSGKFNSAAYPRLAKDGSTIWLQGSYNPIRNKFGKLTSIIKVAHDVTAQRTAQQQYLGLLEVCISRINDVVLITEADPTFPHDSRIIFVNDTFVERTGFSRDEALGKTPRILQGPLTQRDQLDIIRSALESRRPVRAELINYTKAGLPFWAEIDITPITHQAGVNRHWVAVSRDVTKRKETEKQVHELAFRDPLTGLPNRRSFQSTLQAALEQGQEQGGHPVHGALLFVDLDNFKRLNDTHGHSVGDMLLARMAERMTRTVRNSDKVARLGGDEFVLLLGNLNANCSAATDQAAVIGEQVRQRIVEPFTLGTLVYHASASIGIVVFSGDRSQTAEDVLKHADVAMYEAKRSGRNAVRVFDPNMQARLMYRANLEADLKNALDADQLSLAYQSIVDAKRQVTGVEALLRWNRLDYGAVAPSDFIPIAEESGLIVQIGIWVLRTACEQLASWSRSKQHAQLTIAVNVSAAQIRHPFFVRDVLNVLLATKADARLLKLELTESMLLHDVDSIILKMLELRAHGVSFSLDDFGTGYSSLSYLKRLPFTALKIDRSFVRDILVDSNDAAIARTILALGASLGLEVVAEGVETEGQWEFLRENGCALFQGFLFGKPVTQQRPRPTRLRESPIQSEEGSHVAREVPHQAEYVLSSDLSSRP